MTLSTRLLAAMAALSLMALPAIAQETTQIGATQMSNTTRSATLKVPGATLYYEELGSGPTLLIIPGGPQDAGVFTPLAAELADRFKVVSYDPRGNSRTTFDGEPTPLDVDQQADDAAALITHVGGPAMCSAPAAARRSASTSRRATPSSLLPWWRMSRHR